MKQYRTIKSIRDICGTTKNTEHIGEDIIYVVTSAMASSLHEPMLLDMTVAIYCSKGVSRWKVDAVEYEVPAPGVLIVMSGQTLQYDGCGPEGLQLKIIMISERYTSRLTSSAPQSQTMYRQYLERPSFQLEENDVSVIDNYLAMLSALIADTSNPMRLDATVFLTLAFLYAYVFRRQNTGESGSSRQEEIFRQFMVLVKANFREERGCTFYADQLCISPKYLSKVIKGTSGKGALDWIDNFVITESKSLLNSTDMTISQISYHLNFNSPSLFGKYFRRITGMSPKEYRER